MMRAYLWLLTAFLTSALVRIVVKLGSNYEIFPFIAFSYSFGSLFALVTGRKIKERIGKVTLKNSLKFGFLIGIINFIAFYSQLLALSIGKASIIFPITSLAIYLAVILSILVYKEPLTLKKVVGIIFSLIAIILLS